MSANAILPMVVFAVLPCRAYADAGDVSATFSVGASMFQDKLATGSVTTIAKSFSPSEFIGAGYSITDRWRVALNLQFTEAVDVPSPQPSDRFTLFSLLPQVSYRFWWDFSAALIGFFPLRYDSVSQAGYGLQGLVGLALPITSDLKFTAALEVPFLIQPVAFVGLTPIVGLSYRL